MCVLVKIRTYILTIHYYIDQPWYDALIWRTKIIGFHQKSQSICYNGIPKFFEGTRGKCIPYSGIWIFVIITYYVCSCNWNTIPKFTRTHHTTQSQSQGGVTMVCPKKPPQHPTSSTTNRHIWPYIRYKRIICIRSFSFLEVDAWCSPSLGSDWCCPDLSQHTVWFSPNLGTLLQHFWVVYNIKSTLIPCIVSIACSLYFWDITLGITAGTQIREGKC